MQESLGNIQRKITLTPSYAILILPSVSAEGSPPTNIFLVLKSLELDCTEPFGMVLLISTWCKQKAVAKVDA